MKTRIVKEAELWDHDGACRRAREWCLSGEGRSFLELPNSQIAGLKQAVAGAENEEQFEKRARKYLKELADRRKRASLDDVLFAATEEAIQEARELKGKAEAKQRRVFNGLRAEADVV